MGQEPQASSPFRTPTAGSLQSWDKRVRNRLRKGTPLASRGAQGVSGPLLSCVWNLRVFPDELRGKAGGCTRVTAGPKRPHLGLCPGLNVPLKGRQGSWGGVPDSPGESGLVLSEEGKPACLSSCLGGHRALVELCVEPSGVSGRCTGISVPLGSVPSRTGLPSKRGTSLGSSQVRTRESGSFGVWHHPPGSFQMSS